VSGRFPDDRARRSECAGAGSAFGSDFTMMNKLPHRLAMTIGCGAAALLSGCVALPTGPTVFVMPPPNKSYELFVQEDHYCRYWADVSIGNGRDATSNQLAASAVTGAAIGAVAGALAGGHGDAGAGAAWGTVIGSSIGAGQASASAWTLQRSYDITYQQCMYARGNVIPSYYPFGFGQSPG
jgi:hypothetical protein